MTSLHFVLWQSAGAASSQHLALYDQNPPDDEHATRPVLAHWVFPQYRHQRLAKQSHSLLVETTDFPPPELILDAGCCQLLRGALPSPSGLDRLHLCFEGGSLYGHYSLLRLQAGSSRWLFGPIQYMPDKFAQGPFMAPLWPTTQTTLV